ncbi:protein STRICTOSIDINE SYNTHASE-LIKE 5-like [Rhododendron vialii]|uniref:protein STRICTOSIDINE SYNTHASE-LIKE 5-like n=1 Tax=Rhododendron vialii TaxID=182163 RepID=UPI00265E15A4|nr:protein STRICTOSIDINE SYNTHASE-LIKE 5-like [Rhododendron vialii]
MPESSPTRMSKTVICSNTFLLSLLLPVLAAAILYRLDSFDPAPFPTHEFSGQPVFVPLQNPRLLEEAERVGVGELLEPEDLAYDPKLGVIYTGCSDGWIKRVTVNESAADSVAENWVNTGGRPLGLVLGRDNEVIVADAVKGLLRVTEDSKLEVLTHEAEGAEFKLTNGVDVTSEGVVYFTDASSKYDIKETTWDMLEGRPYGRFMSYDPLTKQTQVLVRDLYFANGVAVSPDQQFVIFCESPMRRCKRYYIQGEKKGSVDIFIDNLPGTPDNIHYDGEGQYWIGLALGLTVAFDLAQRYPFIRKVLAIMEKHIGTPDMKINSGVLAIDLEGKPLAYCYDPALTLITGGIKVRDHLYCVSLPKPYVIRLNLTQHPAVSGTVMKS